MSDPHFDSYLMVDWSGASVPVTGANSIWIGHAKSGGTNVENIATRAAAIDRLIGLIAAERSAGRRVLVGFDFPFGYPAGVAERITGQASALAMWDWLASRLRDGNDNANNRFDVASEINRHYDGIGPCWGRPEHWDYPDIPTRARVRHGTDHPPERRLADAHAKGAKTVWQLAYAGSVGSQVLTGLPALSRLRRAPAIAADCAIWPFETGLASPTAPVVIAEIYPSLIAPDQTEPVKDAGQVRAVADWLAGHDADGRLAGFFEGPTGLTADQRRAIETEEAWILGLGDVEQSPKPAPIHYEHDPAEIYRRSFAIVEAEARLDHLPDDFRPVAIRLVHACGMPEITDGLVWSDDIVAAARAALADGCPILCDCEAVAAMVIRDRLPAGNAVICTLNDAPVAAHAKAISNTRSAAAVEFWLSHIEGAVVAIGNAPTALFHLLELVDQGWPRPAAILGFPVGFIGAAESKAALATDPRGIAFLALRGRRGGSAMAAAAVNALAGGIK